MGLLRLVAVQFATLHIPPEFQIAPHHPELAQAISEDVLSLGSCFAGRLVRRLHFPSGSNADHTFRIHHRLELRRHARSVGAVERDLARALGNFQAGDHVHRLPLMPKLPEPRFDRRNLGRLADIRRIFANFEKPSVQNGRLPGLSLTGGGTDRDPRFHLDGMREDTSRDLARRGVGCAPFDLWRAPRCEQIHEGKRFRQALKRLPRVRDDLTELDQVVRLIDHGLENEVCLWLMHRMNEVLI